MKSSYARFYMRQREKYLNAVGTNDILFYGYLYQQKKCFGLDYNDLINNPTNVSAFTNDAGYLTQHQDISGKEDRMGIAATTDTSLAAVVGTYYRFTADVGTLTVTLPTVTDTTKVASIVFYLTTGASPAVTFTSTHSVVYQEGFSLDAGKTYEIKCLFNGVAWVLMAAEINTSS